MRRAAIALLSAALAAPAARAETCNLSLYAELPLLETKAGQPLLVQASIRGQPIAMAIDTASAATTIDKASAEKFGLALQPETMQGQGIGGKLRMFSVRVPDFALGPQRIDEMSVHVVEGIGPDRQAARHGLLGADLLGEFDLEFDIQHNRLGIYGPSNCARAAPWDPDALTVELFRTRGLRIRFDVKVEGKPLIAELDSGATRTLVTWKGARKLGVTPSSPGVEPGHGVVGADGKHLDSSLYRFQTFEIGDEIIRNARFVIAEVDRSAMRIKGGNGVESRADAAPDMYLGADWLRAHHVYVGRGVGLMHFTYAGGPVFEN
jgi:predicted aspartyl protease